VLLKHQIEYLQITAIVAQYFYVRTDVMRSWMVSKKSDKKSGKARFPLISLISFIVFSIGFFPFVLAGYLFLRFFSLTLWWHVLLLPFFIYLDLALAVISQLLISGTIVRLFRLYYKPGNYKYNLSNKTSFKWVVVCTLYTPCRKIMEILPVGPFKNMYYRLMGMKIGNNSLVGGIIKDPCLTEFGDNITMGEYAIIYGHIHNYEKETLIMDKVKIGNNCVIGAGAIIMPGAVLEDNVVLAAGALVRKNQLLKTGKIFGGVPAKEIPTKETSL
jgi:hypothetical protein